MKKTDSLPQFYHSSANNPCPVCDRTKDGDCRTVSDSDAVHCHTFVDASVGKEINGYTCTKLRSGHTATFCPTNTKPRLKAVVEPIKDTSKELSLEHRSREYQQILNNLDLADDHRSALEKRGFTEKHIATLGFKTAERRQSVGGHSPNLAGFENGQFCISDRRIVWGVKNSAGLITCLYSRSDNIVDGKKYLPISTDARELRLSGEIPLGFCLGDRDKPIILVEGHGFKAMLSAVKNNRSVLAANGGQFCSSPELFKAELESLCVAGDEIHLAPDAGDILKISITKRWLKTAKLLESWGYLPRFLWWNQLVKNVDKDVDEMEDFTNVSVLDYQEFETLTETHNPEPVSQTRKFTKEEKQDEGIVDDELIDDSPKFDDSIFEVTTTCENTVLRSLFQQDDKWIVINSLFYKYSGCSVWKIVEDIEIERIVALHLQKLYRFEKDGSKSYVFSTNSNKNNSINFCRSILKNSSETVNNPDLISFDNGVFDTKTRTLLPHSEDYFLTYKIDGNYEECNECPEVVMSWMLETFGSERIDLMRAVISMYVDSSAPWGYFVHLMGQSGGGKGVTASLIQSLLPPETVTGLGTFEEISSPEKRHQYISQSRLAIFEDVGGFLKNVRDFYKLVDNHPLAGRGLYLANGYTRRWNNRFILASVLNLQVENSGDGWSRRCIPIHLKRRNVKNVDTQLKSKLIAHKAGVLNWALSMPVEKRDYMIENARYLPSMVEEQAEQSRQSSSVLQFIDACLEPSVNDADMILSTSLYDFYQSFCQATGVKAFALNKFVVELKDPLNKHFVERQQIQKNGKRERTPACFKNINVHRNIFTKNCDVFSCDKSFLSAGGLKDFEDYADNPASFIIRNEETPIEGLVKNGSILEICNDDVSEVVRVVTARGDDVVALNKDGEERIVKVENAVIHENESAIAVCKELGTTPEQLGFPPKGVCIETEGAEVYVVGIEHSCYIFHEANSEIHIPSFKPWKLISSDSFYEDFR